MKSYYFWMNQAARWQKCVDYGSPMTAWTQEMHDILSECGGDTLRAGRIYGRRKAERKTYDLPQEDWSPLMHNLLKQAKGDTKEASKLLANYWLSQPEVV